MEANILKAYHDNCPLKKRKIKREVPWWDEGLERSRNKVRKLFKKAQSSGSWGNYTRARSEFNKDLRRAKRRTWRNLCKGIVSLPEVSRVQKALLKDYTNILGSLERADGSLTQGFSESVQLLMEVHFSGTARAKGMNG